MRIFNSSPLNKRPGFITPNVQAQWMEWVLVGILFSMLLTRNIFNKITLALALIIYFVCTARKLSSLISLSMKSVPMFVFWFFVVVSYSWSVVPRISLNVILVQTAFILLAMFIIVNCKSKPFSYYLKKSSILVIILVCIFGVAFPHQSYTSAGLNSFYLHKNNFGAYMAVIFLALIFSPNRNKWHVAIAAMAFLLLLGSMSKTAIILVIGCSIGAVFFKKISKLLFPINGRRTIKNALFNVFQLIFLLLIIVLIIFGEEIVDFLWTNIPKPLLTGRGTIWLTVIQQIRSHTLLGIGAGTFWQAGGASEIAQTTLYLNNPLWVQQLGSADGSYIDLLAAFGVIGLSLFLLTIGDMYSRLIKNWQQPDSVFIFTLITFIVLQAVTETTFLHSTNLLWFLYLLSYFRVASYPERSDWNRPNRA